MGERLGLYLEHRSARTGVNMPGTHFHPRHELYFLSSGSRRYFLEHSIYDVSPGDLVLVPKYVLHRTTAPGRRGYDRFLIFFDDEAHRDFFETLDPASAAQLMAGGCFRLSADAARRIRRELEALEREQAAPLPTTRAAAICVLYDVLLAALREGTSREPIHGESADKVQEAARYISEHYDQPITLRAAAEQAFMEQTYFSKRFKHLTGFGFHEYLMQTRLRAAEQLLQGTDLTVGEVAERCGFSGANYFGDVFRRQTGLSPTEFRKENRG